MPLHGRFLHGGVCEDRLVKAAVMPAVQIAVLQRIKAAGVVGQLIGIQLVRSFR